MRTDGQRARHDDQALAHFEKRLLEERRRALRELGALSEVLGATEQARDGELSNYPFHMADQGTDTMELEQSVMLASQEGRLMWHIDEALRHLYRSPETFGTCHRCGQLIDFARLDAIPHTRLCISCKQRAETSADGARDGDADPGAGANGT
jgi:RNA polymerase-binding transcription factor DksA